MTEQTSQHPGWLQLAGSDTGTDDQTSPFVASFLRPWIKASFLSDLNRQVAGVLQYQHIDALALKVLWYHFFALLLLISTHVFLRLPATFPSPPGWQPIPQEVMIVIALLGFCSAFFPMRFYAEIIAHNHYLWRIAVVFALSSFSVLFLYVSGGAIEMYFHYFVVLAFSIIYADWRLGWWVLLFAIVHHIVVELFQPSWLIITGGQRAALLLHIIFLLVMVMFTTMIARGYRTVVVALHTEKRRNDDFLAIASHELKTPLTSIKGYTMVLQQRLKRAPDATSSAYIHEINDQLNRLVGLVRDLLDVSKIQAGGVEFHQERVSIDSLVKEAIEEVQSISPNHKIVQEGLSYASVYGDKTRLYQVMLNLLTNAVKYSPYHDTVTVFLARGFDKVIVSVQDYGIGIHPQDRVKIFEPYYRASDTQRENLPGGLGMGLYICTEIIKRHQGRLWVESEWGQGSTFSFLLPLPKDTL